MDYFATPWLFRARKAMRYVRLYGVQWTYVKIAAQYHMKRRYTELPTRIRPAAKGAHVGIVGCGSFAFAMVAHYLTKHYGRVVRGCMDIDPHRAASLRDRYGASYYTTDADELIADPEIDLIFIASNHASHADYAVRAMNAGKDVHIEKPHVVRPAQLDALCTAMLASKSRVLSIGYNRTRSALGTRIREALWSSDGELMQNWFIAGHQLPADHWYYSDEEGGRVLGNLCHWVEFVYHMMPPERRFPVQITPVRSAKSDCDIAVAYTFGDGSIAALTFSAKGHAFEGVKERYAAHRGDVLVILDDFQDLRIDRRERIFRRKPWARDHGHEAAMRRTYELSRDKSADGCSIEYVKEIGELILQTREALETSSPRSVHASKGAGTL